jgi:hypothetical protein
MFAQFRIHPAERRLWKLHDYARPVALATGTLPQTFMYEMLQIGKNSLASVRNQIVIAAPLIRDFVHQHPVSETGKMRTSGIIDARTAGGIRDHIRRQQDIRRST